MDIRVRENDLLQQNQTAQAVVQLCGKRFVPNWQAPTGSNIEEQAEDELIEVDYFLVDGWKLEVFRMPTA